LKFSENNIYHIYNRGNNREPIYFDDENYPFFLKKLKTELTPYCKILAYCLMPNHFHLMGYVEPKNSSEDLKSSDEFRLKNAIAILLRSYTRAINKQQNRTGSLFQQKTKAKCLTQSDENYPKICFHYIHQNPLRASLVAKMEDWDYSSFKDYTGLRKGTLPEIVFCKEKNNIAINQKSCMMKVMM
jgi:putative transposase